MNNITSKNKMLKILSLFLFISLLYTSCTEDRISPEITGAIKGTIIDSDTQDPIRYVEISTNPATQVLLTDENGEFVLEEIEIGEYKILINKDQYENKMLNAKVKKEDTTFINVLLKKKVTASSSNPPKFLNNFSPSSGSTNLSTTLELSWQVKQSESSDSLSFDIFLYRSDSQTQEKIATNYKDTIIQIEELNYNTVYYWQVIARNQAGDTAHSEIKNFKTIQIPQASFFYSKKINGNYEIMGFNIESGLSTRLTYNSFRDWAPKLNHTNERIAFVSDSLVKHHIFTMSKTGENIQQVSDVPVAGYNNYGNAFCWNDNSGHIFFSHYSYLYRVNQDGTGLSNIATAPPERHFRELEISGNGDKIIALTIGEESYTNEIYIMNIDGSDMTQLISNMEGTIESPVFSIDGNEILFTHDISGHEALDGRQLNSHVFSYNLNTQDTTDLSVNKPLGTNDLYPRYSNTGDKIVFVVSKCAYRPAKGITRFPDGGTPKYLLEETSLYFLDTNSRSIKKLSDFEELTKLLGCHRSNWSTRLAISNDSVYCSISPVSDWDFYFKMAKTNRDSQNIKRIQKKYTQPLVFPNLGHKSKSINDTLFQQKYTKDREVSFSVLKRHLSEIHLSEMGLVIQEIYPKTEKAYIEETIFLKNTSRLARQAVLEQIISKLNKKQIKALLREMDEYKKNLEGREKENYKRNSKALYNEIKALL
mgnify:CR=1 FL=1